jgi:MFS family permease
VFGGYIVTDLDWRWIFFINLPNGMVAIFMASSFLPPDEAAPPSNRKVDWKDVPAASGIYNLTRQLGGSIGIARPTTLLARRQAFHSAVRGEKVHAANPMAVARLDRTAHAWRGKSFSRCRSSSCSDARKRELRST